MQALRSLVYTLLFIAVTAVFGVIVLISAVLPLSLAQRYVIPRTWGRLLTWLAGVVCGLTYTIEGREKKVLMSSIDSLNYYKRILRAGMMAMDPYTGQVKAWVG